MPEKTLLIWIHGRSYLVRNQKSNTKYKQCQMYVHVFTIGAVSWRNLFLHCAHAEVSVHTLTHHRHVCNVRTPSV